MEQRWRNCCGRSAFAWFARPHPHRTAMRTRSALSDRSRRWANGISGSESESSWNTITPNGTTKVIGNEFIEWPARQPTTGPFRRRQRVGGVLNLLLPLGRVAIVRAWALRVHRRVDAAQSGRGLEVTDCGGRIIACAFAVIFRRASAIWRGHAVTDRNTGY